MLLDGPPPKALHHRHPACRNVKYPLLSLGVATCICIIYGMKAAQWNLPQVNRNGYAMTAFSICSFAMSLILRFRIKLVREAAACVGLQGKEKREGGRAGC